MEWQSHEKCTMRDNPGQVWILLFHPKNNTSTNTVTEKNLIFSWGHCDQEYLVCKRNSTNKMARGNSRNIIWIHLIPSESILFHLNTEGELPLQLLHAAWLRHTHIRRSACTPHRWIRGCWTLASILGFLLLFSEINSLPSLFAQPDSIDAWVFFDPPLNTL